MPIFNARRAVAVAGLATAGLVVAAPTTSFASASSFAPASSLASTAPFASTTLAATRISTVSHLWTRATTVHPGQTVSITGTVTYGATNKRVSGKYVWLQVRSGTTWRNVARQKLIGSGWTAFRVPTLNRVYRLYYPGMVSVPGKTAFKGSMSSPLTIRVTPWPASAVGARIVALAAAQSGKPYVFAAAGPNAYDCSGLVKYVFARFGLSLPHDSNAQQNYGHAVSAAAAQPGDLVFFRYSNGFAYHVGIYAGGGYMIDAPTPGQTVGRHRIWSTAVVYRRLR